jgi:hypothetical protein
VPEDYLEERRERRKTSRMRDAFRPAFFLLSLFSSDEKIGTAHPPAQGILYQTGPRPLGEGMRAIDGAQPLTNAA